MNNTESIDCYLPETRDNIDYGPINIENYLGTLDTNTALAFKELKKIVEDSKKDVEDTLN